MQLNTSSENRCNCYDDKITRSVYGFHRMWVSTNVLLCLRYRVDGIILHNDIWETCKPNPTQTLAMNMGSIARSIAPVRWMGCGKKFAARLWKVPLTWSWHQISDDDIFITKVIICLANINWDLDFYTNVLT